MTTNCDLCEAVTRLEVDVSQSLFTLYHTVERLLEMTRSEYDNTFLTAVPTSGIDCFMKSLNTHAFLIISVFDRSRVVVSMLPKEQQSFPVLLAYVMGDDTVPVPVERSARYLHRSLNTIPIY